MRNLYSIFLSVVLLFSSANFVKAQFTINSGDILKLNTRAVEARDTNNPNVSLGVPGFGNTWDFTPATEHEENNTWVVDAQNLPGYSKFPGATLGLDESDDSTYVFFKGTSSKLEILGFTAILPNDTAYEDFNQTIITFPSTISTKFTDDSEPRQFEFEFGGDPDGTGPHPFVDSLMVRSRSVIESDFDAAGTLKTSLGQFNAMRQYSKTKTTDSVFMLVNGSWQVLSSVMSNMFFIDSVSIDTTHEYRFWAEGQSFPLANVQFDPHTGIIFDLTWVKYVSIGIENFSGLEKLNIYPNPAKNELNISGADQGMKYDIIDAMGRIIEHSTISGNSIDISSIPNGNLYLRLYNNEKAIGIGAFQISR